MGSAAAPNEWIASWRTLSAFVARWCCRRCSSQDASRPEQEREQQNGRIDQVQRDKDCARRRDNRKGDLPVDQETPFFDYVRQRASRQRKQEHGQATRDLNQGDHKGISIQACHQPTGRCVVHPGANIGDDGRDPNNLESPMPKGDPRRSTPIRSRSISRQQVSCLSSGDPHHFGGGILRVARSPSPIRLLRNGA